MKATTACTPTATTRSSRLVLLDVLRGVAILGTLATNVWVFAHPDGEYALVADAGAIAPLADSLAETVLRFLANGKFLAMLTILFGVGLAIQHRSAVRRGERWPGRYPRRALLLFAEGTLHYLLIFAYDVLMGYAVTALLVAWLLGRSSRVRNAAMWLAGGVHLTLMLLGTAALLAAPASASTWTVDENLLRTDSYLNQVWIRLEHAGLLRAEPIFAFGLLVFLFLLGVRLFRAGAFAPDERGRRLRRRLLWVGLAIGLPLNIASTVAGPDLVLVDRYVLPPLVTLGYLGLIGTILDRIARPGPVSTSLAALGRTALSGYVLQNLLCAILCYGWGVGLATSSLPRPWWVLGLWFTVSVALVVLARVWLRRFDHGPLEAVQRRLLASRSA
ncbi:DUF418 domain-containing protein [Plantactinospora sp. GCM10030261]|uniref:DUF418 domain-containing protein n=1 Tax=Plantactinospora sp. GCM10030261 TaxID=3273420 RepID=UPI003613991F